MKNYYTKEKNIREFIEGYTIEGDEIVLTLGTGEIYKFKNTKENLAAIREKMRAQVFVGTMARDRVETQYLCQTLLHLVASISVIPVPIAIGLYLLYLNVPIVISIAALVAVQRAIIIFARHIEKGTKKLEEIIDDLDKNEVYIDVEEAVNESLEKQNFKPFNGVTGKTFQMVRSEDFTFDVNSISQMSMEELITIKENLLQLQDAKEAETKETDTETEKAKTLTFKQN